MSRKVGILGVTISGNMGGQVMLRTTLEQLRERFPGSQFQLFSITPEKDRAENQEADLEIVSMNPLTLLAFYFPLAIIFFPFSKLKIVRRLAAVFPLFSKLSKAEVIVDLCGIAFIDGRGLPLLAYNIACCLPAIVVGTPIVKLSQALGPFEGTLNRISAKWVLQKCSSVVARGEISGGFLKGLGLKNYQTLPDTSFAMKVPESVLQEAESIVRASGVSMSPAPLIVCPSRVVQRLCAAKGIDYKAEMIQLLNLWIESGRSAVIVPHSMGEGDSKNNDIQISQEISQHFSKSPQVGIVDHVYDSVLLRAIIGQGKIFVGSRFHSVVAALATGVPSLVIGWSHKYQEMVDFFELGSWVYDLKDFSAENLYQRLCDLDQDEPKIREQINNSLPQIRSLAAQNYDLVERVL